MSGKLIVIDGTDGCGKETQTQLLIHRLNQEKFKVHLMDFPRYESPSSIGVREYLSGNLGGIETNSPKVPSLFYALDRYHAKSEMIDYLDNNYVIISNRYVSANMGHQGSKISNSNERKLFFQWLYDIEYKELGIPKPNLNIILYCPTEITKKLRKKRGRKSDIHEDNPAHQKKSAEIFIELTKQFSDFELIECTQNSQLKSKETIHELIWEHVKKIIS